MADDGFPDVLRPHREDSDDEDDNSMEWSRWRRWRLEARTWITEFRTCIVEPSRNKFSQANSVYLLPGLNCGLQKILTDSVCVLLLKI